MRHWRVLATGLLLAHAAWAQNTWSPAGTMSSGRVLHTFTALADGRGLAVGGKPDSFTAALDTAEAYDPATNAWSPVARMGTPRADHSATVLADGRVLVVGGCSNGAPCNPPGVTAQLYNPSTNTWSAAGSLHEARALHTANRLPDGRVIVFGGQGTCNAQVCITLSSTEIYDPASNSWSFGPPLPQPRQQSTSSTLPDGRVLVAGGCSQNGLPCTPLDAVVYNPASNSFGNAIPMVVPRSWHMAVAMDGGDVLLAGGVNGNGNAQKSAEVFRVASGSFVALPDSLFGHFEAAMERLPSGDVLIAAGQGGGDPTGRSELFSAAAGLWAQVGTLAQAREYPRMARLAGGAVVLVGGIDANLIGVAAAERFQQGPTPLVQLTPAAIDFGYQALFTTSDIHVLSVANVGAAPLNISSVSLAGTNPADFSFSSGCSGPVAPGAHCEIQLRFRPQAVKDRNAVLGIVDDAPNSPHEAALSGFGYVGAPNFWAPAGTMNQARFGHTLTALPDGRALAVGGGYEPDAVDLFSANSWSAAAPLAVPRIGHSSTVLADGRILAAGGAATASAELFSLPANAWAATGAMQQRRSGHAAARLASGKVIVFGGCISGPCASTEIYDPASNAWSAGPTMSVSRSAPSATVLQDGRVLVAGGSATLKQAEIYDPVSNSFSAGGTQRQARIGHSANRLPDGRVLLAGGCGGSYCVSAEIFDPAGNRWLRAPAMTLPRVSHVSLTLQDGRVAVAGGIYFCEGEFGFCFSTRGVDVFDPKRGRWSVFPGLLESRADFAGTVLPDGRLLVSGGNDSLSDPKATAEVLVPKP